MKRELLRTLTASVSDLEVRAFIDFTEAGKGNTYNDFGEGYRDFVTSSILGYFPTVFELKKLAKTCREKKFEFSKLGKLPEPDTIIQELLRIREDHARDVMITNAIFDEIDRMKTPQLPPQGAGSLDKEGLKLQMKMREWGSLDHELQTRILDELSWQDFDDETAARWLRAYWAERLNDEERAAVERRKSGKIRKADAVRAIWKLHQRRKQQTN